MLKRFFAFYKPHKKLFIIDTICAFLVSACNLVYPMIAKNIINIYVPDKKLQLLIVWCVVLLAVYLVKALLTYVIQYWGHLLGVRIQGDMRRAMFAHLQKLPFTYFDNNKTGAIMSRMINDLFNISELAHHGPEDMFMSVISIVGAFVMLATINIYLTLIVFIFIPVLLLFAVRNRKRMNSSFMQMRRDEASVNADIETTVSGVRVTKAYGSEDYVQGRFDRANNNYQKARGSAYKAMGIFGAGMGFISDFLYLAVLLAGGLFFYYGIIDTGEFAAYILFISMLLTPIRTIVTLYEEIQSGSTGFRRFCEIMDEPEERDAEDAVTLGEVKGDIEFKNVEFSYAGKEEDVLEGVSFSIPHGKTTALVGGSGGVKEHDLPPHPAFLRIERRGNHPRRHRHREDQTIFFAGEDRHRRAGRFHFRRLREGKHRLREGGRFGRGNRRGGETGEYPRLHRFPAGRLRYLGGRAGRAAFGRTAAEDLHRARLPQKSAHPHSGRGDQRARQHHGNTDSACAQRTERRAHGRRRGAPAFHHPFGGSDRRDRAGEDRGKGTHEELVQAGGRYAEMLGEKING